MPSKAPRLDEGEVHIWCHPNSSAVSREVVSLLAGYLDVDPGSVIVGRGERGKPELGGVHRGQLGFNVSHGGGVALLAVSRSSDVGVDVEPLRSVPADWALVRQALTSREQHMLELDGGDEASGFIRVWVRKEALLKAAGVGLAVEPKLVELQGTRIVSLPSALGEPDSWTLIDLSVLGHVAAVAVAGPEPRLRLFA